MIFSIASLWSCQETQVQEFIKEDETPIATYEQLDSMLDRSFELYNNGDFNASLQNNLATIKLAEASKNDFAAHDSYSYLGYDYLILEDTIRALESFQKSFEYGKKTGEPILVANAYLDFAGVYVNDSMRHKEGLDYYKKALEIYRAENDSIGLQGGYYNYALELLQLDDNQEFDAVLDSLVKYSTHPGLHDSFKAGVYSLQGKNFLRKKEIKPALEKLQQALEIGERLHFTQTLEDTYKSYARAYEQIGDYSKAYRMLSKYDSVYQINLKGKSYLESQKATAKFQIDKVEEELSQAQLEFALEEEKVKQRTLINYVLAALIIFGVAIIIFFYYLSHRRKTFILTLKEKNKEIEKAKIEAEELAKVKSDFFSTISHELRTPLYGVIGLTSILLEKHSHKKDLQELESLKFSADYLLALVNDVLHLNKLDSKKGSSESNVFSLKALLSNILSSFEYLRVQNNNTLETQFNGDIPALIEGKSTELSQILMNLVGNACKFTENGKVIIAVDSRVDKDNAFLRFSITDTGQGIAPNKIKNIFEEFAQGESKNITYQGTGLGLSIVKKLLHAAGSEIYVESHPGAGSTFSFTMTYPIIDQVESLPGADKHNKLQDLRTLRGTHILIVEDNRINQMVTQKILEKYGVVCDIASHGQQGVDMIQENHYDLVLMDVNMPILNGIEATIKVRTFSDIPIIALTAVELDEMREQIYKCGMNDIIVKPYDIDSFEQTILKGIHARTAQTA